MTTMKLPLSRIRRDGGTQSRAELNHEVVEEYGDAMLAGTVFDPVVVFHDGTEYWLADGFHRCEAASAAGLAELHVDVRQGTRRDAVLYSVGANARHGLRRTSADKRRAVEVLLADAEWNTWSDRKIAEACGVGYTLVATVRKRSLPETGSEPRRFVTRHGTEAVMNTANIGRSPAAPSAPPAPPPVDLDAERKKRDAAVELATVAERALDEAVRAVRAAIAEPAAATFTWNHLEVVLPVLQRLARRTA